MALKRSYKLLNQILISLLGLLGFASVCLLTGCKYGEPMGYYIKGKVEDVITQQPIEHIKVSLKNDNTFTNSSGMFYINNEDKSQQPIMIRFSDVDDTLHGRYQDKDTTVSSVNDSIPFVNVKLQEKK